MLNIETVLDNLNAGYGEIISLVPDRYNFSDDSADMNWDGFPHGSKVHVLPSGKVLWCGSTNADQIYVSEYSDSYYKNNFLRFNADGTLDETFGPVYVKNGNNGFIHDFALQSDGKIIVVGTFNGLVNGVSCNYIIRLNADGSVDETFVQGTGFNNNAVSVNVLSDDTIIVGGRFSTYNGNSCSHIAKLDADGEFDGAFSTNVGGTFNGIVHAITITGTDDIYAGGQFFKKIAKLASDGTPDATFDGNIGSGFSERVAAIAIQSDNKIVVGHWGNTFDGGSVNKLTRLESNGTIDSGFGTLGVDFEFYNNGPMAVAIQADNKILVGGWFVSFNGLAQRFLARFNTDGSIDTSLNIAEKFAYTGYAGPRINDIAISGTNIFVTHSLYYYENTKISGLSKLNSTGSLQEGFNVPATANIDYLCDGDGPLGFQVLLQPNGKLLYVCDSSRYDGLKKIRRFNVDGSEDESFILPYVDGRIRAVALQSDGKIIIGGDFDGVNGINYQYLARLNSDGTLDTDFNTGDGPSNSVFAIEVLGDNSIWIGGSFGVFDGNSTNYIANLNSDGSFNHGSNEIDLNNTIHCLKVDGSGNVYVGGRFSSKIMRLLSDGSKDTGFAYGSGFNSGVGNNPRVTSIKIDGDGKIVVGHWFTTYDGSPCNPGITRHNTDGSLDETFLTEGNGLVDSNNNGLVQSVAIQSNGKILAGGWFDTYNDEAQNKIIRLNSDGTKDNSFEIGTGFNVNENSYNGTRIQSVIIDGLGKIYCAGNAYTYNNLPCYPVTRIMSDGSQDFDFEAACEVTLAGINDGGDDMYDDANFINTNLTQSYETGKEDDLFSSLSIPFTHKPIYGGEGSAWDFNDGDYIPVQNGKVVDGTPYFGSGSQYFTNMYEGMFVLAATGISINEFSILGNIGADGDGTVSNFVILANGNNYTVFMKNVFNAGDPSINQLIIVPGNGDGITQLYDESSEYDDHCLQGLNVDEIYYIVVSRSNEEALSQEDAMAIATKFLEVIGASTAKSYTLHLGGGVGAGYDAEGNMDTTVQGGVSLQRTGYLELVNAEGGRKVVEFNDGETVTDTPQTLPEYFPAIPN